MKRFKTRMDALLDHSDRIERRCSIVHAAAMRELAAAYEHARGLSLKVSKAVGDTRNMRAGGMTSESGAASADHLTALAGMIREHDERIIQMEARARFLRDELVVASRRRKMMTQMRAKLVEDASSKQRRSDQNTMDEIASRRTPVLFRDA